MTNSDKVRLKSLLGLTYLWAYTIKVTKQGNKVAVWVTTGPNQFTFYDVFALATDSDADKYMEQTIDYIRHLGFTVNEDVTP